MMKMKAVYLAKKGGAESLVSGEILRPSPEASQLIVKVHATAIIPAEIQWSPTLQDRLGAPRPFPVVLGHEFSGVVEIIGPNVSGFQAGEEIFGVNDWFTNGAQAEYCLEDQTRLAQKPKSLSHTEAAVVPTSALTAWQGLFERGNLQRGQRVLIHGAAGTFFISHCWVPPAVFALMPGICLAWIVIGFFPTLIIAGGHF
jgi:NADPH:quinone reductase-like Zn-dependent oxidoreductase